MISFVCCVAWIAFTIPFSIDSWITLKEWQKVVAQLAVFCGMCLIVRELHEEGFKQMVIAAIGVGPILCCRCLREIAFECPAWEGGDKKGVLPEAAEIW